MALTTGLLIIGLGLIWRAMMPDGLSRDLRIGLAGGAAVLTVVTLARYDTPAGALTSLPFVLIGPAAIGFLSTPLTEDWSVMRLRTIAFAGLGLLLVAAMLPKAH